VTELKAEGESSLLASEESDFEVGFPVGKKEAARPDSFAA
jgi:hypothetical protein